MMRKIVFVIIFILAMAGTVTAKTDGDAICGGGQVCAEWMDGGSEMYLLCNGTFTIEVFANNALHLTCGGLTNNNYLPVIREEDNDG